jgi:hypothetical protein
MTAKQKANIERFKKVVAEAKKLRAKNPKLTQPQAVKQAWAMFKKSGKVGESHKDTKSHNVNIRVVSGWKKGKTAMIEKNEAPKKRLKNVRVTRIAKKSKYSKPGTFARFKTLGNVKIANVPMYKDKDAAREIQLYADNDSTLYFQRKLPILKNLQRKYQKGTFDVNKAAKLWQYYVEAAMQKYNKDFGSKSDKWSDILSVPDRKLLSMEYAIDTQNEFQSGNFY